MNGERYFFFDRGGWAKDSLREVVEARREHQGIERQIWSARLSTGLFGLPDCPAGNRSGTPKGEKDVILARGSMGLIPLIGLGFISCPACHPELTEGFTQAAALLVLVKYKLLESYEQWFDRSLVPFDAARVNWEGLAKVGIGLPPRLYLRARLVPAEVVAVRQRLAKLTSELPELGYYDRNAPGHFVVYE